MLLLKSSLKHIAFIFLFAGTIISSAYSAENVYITDDYLKGLDDEASSPEYLKKAKKELLETELREQSSSSTTADIQKALFSMYNFEALLRTKYPSSHSVYSKLPISARIHIFDQFKSTKKLSTAKRIIIEKYIAK